MENLREIAVGAMTGHWPAHLGLKTDQEKIEYLARALEKNIDLLDDPCFECSQCEHCAEHGGS